MSIKSLLIMTATEEISHLVQQVAVKAGYAAIIVSSGLHVVSDFEKLKPSLMVLDMDLNTANDIDGVELLNHFGKMNCRVPIILISQSDEKLLFSLHHVAVEKKLHVISTLMYPFSEEEFEYKLNLSKHNLSVIEPLDIAQAIENKHFVLYYQPKIHTKTKTWIGVETLIRWAPPGQHLILPDAFIPLTEESGLIVPMTSWVVKQAFTDLLEFQRDNFNIKLAVNLSSKLLSDVAFPDEMIRLTREMNLSPEMICFEVTESATSNQPEKMLEVLLRLRLKGFSLSIDDFGTGYSSLVELQRLPFNELKIDKSFIMNLEHTPMNQSIVKAIIYLGHTLGLSLVAEGVESREALSLLDSLGCDIAQGYLISPPMSIAELKEWRANYITDNLEWAEMT